jgi:hypothetical protein
MSSNLIKQLKDLKEEIKPLDSWVNEKRDILVAQISSQISPKKSSYAVNSWFLAKSVMPGSFLKFVARPIGVISLLAIFVFGSGMLSVNASKGSLPGDFLYSVKLTSEKVKVSLTSAKEKKAQLHVGFAEERMNEIETVLVTEKDATIKQQKVKTAVVELKKDLQKAQDTIEEAKNEPEDSASVVLSAQAIEKKTGEISVKIEQNKQGSLDDKEITKDLNEAEDATSETSVKAIEVIIDKYEDGEVEISEVDLVDVIQKKIDSTEKKVQEASETAETAKGVMEKNALFNQVTEDKSDKIAEDTANEDLELTEKQDVEDVDSSKEEQVIDSDDESQIEDVSSLELTTEEQQLKDVTDVIDTKPDQAEEAISDAQELLSQGDLTSAIQKVKESASIVKEVNLSVGTVVDEEQAFLDDEAYTASQNQSTDSPEVLIEYESEENLADEVTTDKIN